MSIIEIPYTPRKWASKLHDSTTRWIVMVLHRRAGKSTAVLNHLQRSCLQIPNSQFAYFAPTYRQAKRIGWKILKEIAEPIPNCVPNESELIMRYPNGSQLFLAGSENVHSFRGIPLWGGAQDEDSQQPPNLFSEVISKCLADHLGYWIFFGTPQGKNHFHRTYSNAIGDKDWTVIYKTIDDSLEEETGETIDNLRVALEDDKKLVAKGEMTQEEFEQEWYCSFEAAVKGAYYAKEIGEARRSKRITSVAYDKAVPVHTVSDLGKGQNFATGFYQKVGNEIRKIDYWQGEESDGIPELAVVLQNKGYVYGKHFAPHDIKATELGTGKTRLETALKLGIKFEVIPDIGVDDGINAGKLMFSRLWVDETKCAPWLDAMANYRQRYDEKRGMFMPEPYHDWSSHGADEYRYAAVVEKDMSNDKIQKRERYVQNNDYQPAGFTEVKWGDQRNDTGGYNLHRKK